MLFFTGAAMADFKYTEETKNNLNYQMPQVPDMPPQFQGMMQNMMQQNMQNMSNATTIYIKGSRERRDIQRDNASSITMCDKKQIVGIDHNNKTYTIESMDEQIALMKSICNGTSPVAPPNANLAAQKVQPSPLLMKTRIIDTGKDEMIGSLKARHYVKEVFISGNPTCIPDVHTVEHLWATNFQPEEFQCPLLQYKDCKEMPQIRMNRQDCSQNMKIVKEGLNEVPGFIVKREVVTDMSQIMKGAMGAAPPAGAMGSMMGGEGNKVTTITLITNISKNPLPATLFEIPAGYKQVSNLGNDDFKDFQNYQAPTEQSDPTDDHY